MRSFKLLFKDHDYEKKGEKFSDKKYHLIIVKNVNFYNLSIIIFQCKSDEVTLTFYFD